MPTGFTSKLYEGEPQTFAEFALHTARAFGPAAMIREEPSGPVRIEAVQQDLSYREGRILESGKRIGELLNMSDEQLEQAATKQFQAELKGHLRSNQLDRRRRAAYIGMLDEVEAWNPPTPNHEPLKDYMREQLQRSLSFDCSEELDPFKGLPVKKTPEEYRETQLDDAQREFDRNLGKFGSASADNAKSVEWVQQLQDSLEN